VRYITSGLIIVLFNTVLSYLDEADVRFVGTTDGKVLGAIGRDAVGVSTVQHCIK